MMPSFWILMSYHPDKNQFVALSTYGSKQISAAWKKDLAEQSLQEIIISTHQLTNSEWTKCMSSVHKHVPTKMTSQRYSKSCCNRSIRWLSRQNIEHFGKPSSHTNIKTGSDIAAYRSHVKRGANRPWTATNVCRKYPGIVSDDKCNKKAI